MRRRIIGSLHEDVFTFMVTVSNVSDKRFGKNHTLFRSKHFHRNHVLYVIMRENMVQQERLQI